MADPFRRPAFVSAVYYRHPTAALEWLEKAFGFTRSMVITDTTGAIAHSEMSFRGGHVMIGPEWTAYATSPAAIDGRNTQSVHVQLEDDLDAHCERARSAGAAILREPADEFYGDRTYTARDLEGHVWTFGRSVRTVSREEAEEASGLKIEGWV